MTSSVEFYDKTDLRVYASERAEYLAGIDDLILATVDKGSTILDVGSGDGVRIKQLGDLLESKVVALDNSPGMVERCRKLGLEAYCASIENFQLPRQFDVVTCLWSVFATVDPGPAMKNMAAMLKPGRKLFLDVNVRLNVAEYGLKNCLVNWLTGRCRFKVKGTDCLAYLFDYWELDRHFRAEGLQFGKEYRNYRTGKKTWPFLGQLLYVAHKPHVD